MRIHCLFEQSGTFKNVFRSHGIESYDYDILNDYGQTDFQIDLFKAIEDAYDGKPSIFDTFQGGGCPIRVLPLHQVLKMDADALERNIEEHSRIQQEG